MAPFTNDMAEAVLSDEAMESDSLKPSTNKNDIAQDDVESPLPSTYTMESDSPKISTKNNDITQNEVKPPLPSTDTEGGMIRPAEKLPEDEEDTAYDPGLGSRILAHFKLLASGSKTMWRMLLCSFLYTFLIFEETDIFLAVREIACFLKRCARKSKHLEIQRIDIQHNAQYLRTTVSCGNDLNITEPLREWTNWSGSEHCFDRNEVIGLS